MTIVGWGIETLATNGAFSVQPVAPLAFTGPTSAVQDPATGNIFVVEPSLHRIRKVTPAGVVTTLTSAFTNDTTSMRWCYFADDKLWVTDQGGGAAGAGFLYSVDPVTGAKTTVCSGLTQPQGVIVTADGATAWVACLADYWFGILGSDLNSIDVGSGVATSHFQYPRGGFSSFLTDPMGVSFAPGTEQFVYVLYITRTESIDRYDSISDAWATISLNPSFLNAAGLAPLPVGTDPDHIYMVHTTDPGTDCNNIINHPTIQSVNFLSDVFTQICGSAFIPPLCQDGWIDSGAIPIPAPAQSLASYSDPGGSALDGPIGISLTTRYSVDGALLIADTVNNYLRLLTPDFEGPTPPPPPPPVVTVVKRLGCGQYVIAYAMRGGALRGIVPDVVGVEFSRKLNDVSSAKITLGGGAGGIGGFSSSCCEAVNKITCLGGPLAVEIHIFRNLELVWCGPITDMLLEPDTGKITIDCRDLFTLFDRRFWHGTLDPTLPYPYIQAIIAKGGDVNPDLDASDVDITNVFYTVAYDAMFPEPTSFSIKAGIHNSYTNSFDIYDFTAIPGGDPNYGYTSIMTGFNAERYISQTQYVYSGQILREVSQEGIDFTMVNRVLYTGSEQMVPGDLPIGIFTDGAFQKAPSIHIVGLDMGTRFVVGANGTGTDGPYDVADTSSSTVPLFNGSAFPVAMVANDPTYGLLEIYEYIGDIRDTWNNGGSKKGPFGEPLIHGVPQPYFAGPLPPASDPDGFSLWQAAITRYQQFAKPYGIVEGAQLKDDAPFDMNDLIPGVHVGVRLAESCVQILQDYRLRDVTVSADTGSEAVGITLIPLGTTVYGQPTANTGIVFGSCAS